MEVHAGDPGITGATSAITRRAVASRDIALVAFADERGVGVLPAPSLFIEFSGGLNDAIH